MIVHQPTMVGSIETQVVVDQMAITPKSISLLSAKTPLPRRPLKTSASMEANHNSEAIMFPIVMSSKSKFRLRPRGGSRKKQQEDRDIINHKVIFPAQEHDPMDHSRPTQKSRPTNGNQTENSEEQTESECAIPSFTSRRLSIREGIMIRPRFDVPLAPCR